MSMGKVVVVGAGIVGAACAEALARADLEVTIVDPRPGGAATAAGMGHVLVVEDDPALLELTRRGRELWEERANELPPEAQWDRAGTLWVAANDSEFALAMNKAAQLETAGVSCEWHDAHELEAVEPCLRPGLRGGLRVPGDRVLYPPVASAWLLQGARAAGAEVRSRVPVAAIRPGEVELADGEVLGADFVVNAAGAAAPTLMEPGLVPELRMRKGHLAITSEYPGFLRHQVIELGYLASAASNAKASVAFNLQPRTTGQVLIGSSRQFGEDDARADRHIVARMLTRALEFVPTLGALDVVRVWAGFRVATADKRPLVGPVAEAPGVLLAAGHEGLGITTALSTAELVLDDVLGRASAIERRGLHPARFRERERASA